MEAIVSINATIKYDVIIKQGTLNEFCYLDKFNWNKCALITDSNVDSLYADTIIDGIKKSGKEVVKYVFKAGEQSKNLSVYGEIIEFLAKNNLTRGDLIVALGGGVTGDMAGFAAATYMRGIRYIQIPTTLLAAIDSSVGGKTAVDLSYGKNLVGAFHQPSLVVFDSITLKTLPKKYLLDGYGEALKYAILDGGEIYDIMRGGINDENVNRLVELCIKSKKRIVEEDEFEAGNRKLLNLGHTVGHAIEKLNNYTLTHGVCVAKGLKVIADVSFNIGLLSKKEHSDIMKLLCSYDIDLACTNSADELIEAIYGDKKSHGNSITVVLIKSIGECQLKEVSFDELGGMIKCAL